ncbi:Tumor necrosis factor ligand superfamily member 18-like protein [Aix galericulata]|nr:Tumor necrosis factor ligand superfamily member 18-like protein [Aix galericulata]
MIWEWNLKHCDDLVQQNRKHLIIKQNGNYFIYAQISRQKNVTELFTVELYKEPNISLNKAIGPKAGDEKGMELDMAPIELCKMCLREFETNHLEMSPNTTPRIQAMPGKAANLAMEQGPLPATKLQSPSPPYLAQQRLLRSSTSQSAPLGLQQKSWEFSSEVPTLLGSPTHTCSHLSHYMSRSSLGGSRKRGQVAESRHGEWPAASTYGWNKPVTPKGA